MNEEKFVDFLRKTFDRKTASFKKKQKEAQELSKKVSFYFNDSNDNREIDFFAQLISRDIVSGILEPVILDQGFSPLFPEGINYNVAVAIARRMLQGKSPHDVIQWLKKIHQVSEAAGFCVMPLIGIEVKEEIVFSNGIRLLPFSQLPESRYKKDIGSPFPLRSGMNFRPCGSVPEVALFCPFTGNVKLCLSAESPQGICDIYKKLETYRLLLSLIDYSGPVNLGSWFQFEDVDFDEIQPLGYRMYLPNVFPNLMSMPVTIDPSKAKKIVSDFFSLNSDFQERLMLPLHRWCQVNLRGCAPLAKEDNVVDLAIILESLLSTPEDRHSSKTIGSRLRERAFELVGGSNKERKKIGYCITKFYDLRSSIVHGSHNEISDIQKLFSDTREICLKIILEVIRRGEIPEWDKENSFIRELLLS